MMPISNVLSVDFKNIRRDPTLLLLLFIPFVMLLLCRLAVPQLLLINKAMADYFIIIVLLLALMNAMFPAFIMAFILLDEKELQLHAALKVTPASLSGLLKVRLGILFLMSFAGSLMLILFSGLHRFNITDAFAISLLCALSAPILTLLIAAVAKNKVEGLTLLKVANVTLFIPILAQFIQTPWEYLLGIFPAFWAIHFLNPILNPLVVFILGLLLISLMNYGAFRFALRKMG